MGHPMHPTFRVQKLHCCCCKAEILITAPDSGSHWVDTGVTCRKFIALQTYLYKCTSIQHCCAARTQSHSEKGQCNSSEKNTLMWILHIQQTLMNLLQVHSVWSVKQFLSMIWMWSSVHLMQHNVTSLLTLTSLHKWNELVLQGPQHF